MAELTLCNNYFSLWRYYIINYYFEYIGMADWRFSGSNVFNTILNIVQYTDIDTWMVSRGILRNTNVVVCVK